MEANLNLSDIDRALQNGQPEIQKKLMEMIFQINRFVERKDHSIPISSSCSSTTCAADHNDEIPPERFTKNGDQNTRTGSSSTKHSTTHLSRNENKTQSNPPKHLTKHSSRNHKPEQSCANNEDQKAGTCSSPANNEDQKAGTSSSKMIHLKPNNNNPLSNPPAIRQKNDNRSARTGSSSSKHSSRNRNNVSSKVEQSSANNDDQKAGTGSSPKIEPSNDNTPNNPPAMRPITGNSPKIEPNDDNAPHNPSAIRPKTGDEKAGTSSSPITYKKPNNNDALSNPEIRHKNDNQETRTCSSSNIHSTTHSSRKQNNTPNKPPEKSRANSDDRKAEPRSSPMIHSVDNTVNSPPAKCRRNNDQKAISSRSKIEHSAKNKDEIIKISKKPEIKLTQIEDSENYYDEHGYIYSKNNTSEKLKNSYYRCKSSVGQHCPARIIAKNKNLKSATLSQKHSHLPVKKCLDKEKFDKKLDRTCHENLYVLPRELYFKAREQTPNEADIPLRQGYRSFIHRRQKEHIPLIPNSIDQFDELINDDRYRQRYCFDKRDHIFYRGVWTNKNSDRMVVFLSESMLQAFKNMTDISFIMDGTFKCLPRHMKFSQLYIMSFIYEDRCYPFGFVLMEKRDFASYDLLFEKLSFLISADRVSKCMTDYEAACRKALRKHFPNARISGCYFHYVKAINKASRKFGLSKDEKFKEAIQKVSALALLPNEFISKGFETIERAAPVSKRWDRFSKYWRRQWQNANISVYGLKDRTNNFAESLNRSFNLLNGKPHQKIWILLKNLKQLEMDQTDEYKKHFNGKMFDQKRNKEMIQLNDKIEKATSRFEETEDVERFLKNVTYGDDLTSCFKDRIFIEGVDDSDYEDYCTDGNEDCDDQLAMIPNDFDDVSNFKRKQETISNKKRKAEELIQEVAFKKKKIIPLFLAH